MNNLHAFITRDLIITRNRQGMSLIEVMVAGVLLAIMITIIIGAFQQLKHRQHFVATQQTQIWAVHHLVEQVKSMVQMRPKRHTSDDKTMVDALNAMKDKVSENLDTAMPIVWSHRRIESSEKSAAGNLKLCPECQGRMGYLVVPLKNFPGYVLTIAISHPEIFMQQLDEKNSATDVVVYKQFILGSS